MTPALYDVQILAVIVGPLAAGGKQSYKIFLV